MITIWSNKTLLFLKIFFITTGIVIFFYVYRGYFGYALYTVLKPLLEQREISLVHYLPSTASDVNEKTDYLQPPPDEEYRYYLKAKISKEEFLELVEELDLEWASPVNRSHIPLRCPEIQWWNPPHNVFLYAKRDRSDNCMQADYVETAGYVYLYIEQY